MASLHKLLSEDGFQRQKSRKPKQKVKFKDRSRQEDSFALPIYICHDRRNFDSSLQMAEKALSLKGSSVFSSKKGDSGSEKTPRKNEPAIDDVAIRAMVSILSGYVGQYSRDKKFRQKVREKCSSCFERWRNQHSDGEIFAHMEMGIHGIESLVESQEEMDLEATQKCIKILKIVASLDSSNEANSCLTACAQLYLSIVYKIAKNDKISARHLLQVFIEFPFLARTLLLPEPWEHVFLPHLLHIKIWYNKELDFLASLGRSDREKMFKALNEKYDEQMDIGTAQFALYYKEWLKVGAQAPSVPSVPLPSYARPRRKSLESSTSHQAVINKSLYQVVFGPVRRGKSMDLDNGNGASKHGLELEVEKNVFSEEDIKHYSHVEKKVVAQRMPSSQSYRMQEPWPDRQKSDYFRLLGCRAEPTEFLVQEQYLSRNDKIEHDEKSHFFQLNDTARAIATICSSESLADCEMAIRGVAEAWLDSHGDKIIETSLSQASVIQGMTEVLSVSDDDEVLELAISILVELATKSETNRRCILDLDPQLSVSIRLLRSSSLFLKAAALLYLVKPKAEQMVSVEWIPLVLRVLEFGDHLQILFSVRCSPHEAAYYFLEQLLTGFQEWKNLENAKEIISLGGLRLLVRRMDDGDAVEKSKAASVLYYCIQADGSCRHFLAKNLKKESIICLIAKQRDPHGHALGLLTELLCLSRRNQRLESLTELTNGWDCLNTMHILLIHLQRARPEDRPIIAVILLQLDLLGDPFGHSIYREEAIDAMIKALDSCVLDEKIQQQSARALLILGGHFSYTGESEVERWLLRKASLDENVEYSSSEKDFSIGGYLHLNEKDNWQRKAAIALLTSGNKRLFPALSDSIANSIPCLARASLVTISWISIGFQFLGDKDLQLSACSILVPQLTEFLNDNTPLEEKILVSFSLHSLTKDTDYFSRLSRLEKEFVDCLDKLSRLTWTAKELISLIRSSSLNQLP